MSQMSHSTLNDKSKCHMSKSLSEGTLVRGGARIFWFCLTVRASIYRKSTLVPVLLNVINIWDSCPKSSQKIWPEPDLAGFAKEGQMPDLPELKSGTSLALSKSNYQLYTCSNMRVFNYPVIRLMQFKKLSAFINKCL